MDRLIQLEQGTQTLVFSLSSFHSGFTSNGLGM